MRSAALWCAAVAAAALLPTGCGDIRRERQAAGTAADNTAAVCAEVRAVTTRHVRGGSPEGRVLGDDVRAAAERATRPETRAAVIDLAGVLSNPDEGGTERRDAAVAGFTALCGEPAPPLPE